MRPKLQTFTDFTDSLLPHETHYLLSIQQFEDPERLAILQRVDHNCRHIDQFTAFEEGIDKRKYAHLKNWITDRLKAIDVDEEYEWMSRLEQQITIDAITPEEEKKLLKEIRNYEHPKFFFTKFYELVEHYRHFLLIRMRYADHQLTNDFLETYREAYLESKRINEQIHEATLDIVQQYSENNAESIQWEKWLAEVFFDEKTDGLNRYLALVRLIFIGLNYGKFDTLREKFDYIDALFKEGKYYSRRLLLNYYSNRLLLHTKFQELDKATYYGYLSIREKTHDYIFYVNNLCAVLLRQKKYKAALQLMKKAAPEMKKTKNFHSKIGFVAFHVKSLNANELYKNGENLAESFLLAYRKEVLQYRWHIFFTTYLETLLFQKKYLKVLRTIRKYQLMDRDKKYQKKTGYLPTIPWYLLIAEYKEGDTGREVLFNRILSDVKELHDQPGKDLLLEDLLGLVRDFLDSDFRALKRSLEKAGFVPGKF